MTDQTEREALADLVCRLTHTNGGRCDNQHRLLHLSVADSILAAGFHRTPAPVDREALANHLRSVANDYGDDGYGINLAADIIEGVPRG